MPTLNVLIAFGGMFGCGVDALTGPDTKVH
jgi:hypothetical protein